MEYLFNRGLFRRLRDFQLSSPSEIIRLVARKPNLRVVDLGCGNGEFTRKLADSLPYSDVLGIDPSSEMIRKAKAFARQGLRFEQTSIEEFTARDANYDLIFSKAALRFVDNHSNILTDLIKRIAPGGQLVVQMVVMEARSYSDEVDIFTSEIPLTLPVLCREYYSNILVQNGGTDVKVFGEVYNGILPDAEVRYECVATNMFSTNFRKLSQEQNQASKDKYKSIMVRKNPQKSVCFSQNNIYLSAKFSAPVSP